MIEFGTFKNCVYDWACKQSGLVAIWEEQARPRPRLPYVGLKLVNPSIRVGRDEITVDDQGRSHVIGLREMVVAVNVYGEGAVVAASTMQASTDLPGVVDRFLTRDLTVVETSEVRDLSTLLETNFETRAQLEVRFRYSIDLVDAGSGPIEEVQIDGFVGLNDVTIDVEAPV